VLQGCANHRTELAEAVSAYRGQTEIISTTQFDLMSASNMSAGKVDTLRIYIEGDGKAWATRSQPSTDPSPRNLLMARLALADPHPSVYLARPCQFHKSAGCGVAMWTDKRFTAPVIQSFNDALDKLKARHGAQSLELIGYSGGGYVAMVLAGMRSDVTQLQTLAGNIDPQAWARHHQISPLANLEDISDLGRLNSLPQEHFVGSNDKVVPASLVEAFVGKQRFSCASVTRVAADHESGWAGMSVALNRKPHCTSHRSHR